MADVPGGQVTNASIRLANAPLRLDRVAGEHFSLALPDDWS